MIFLPEDMWEVRSTPHKGRGIFAKKEIKPGVIVGDYIGKVLSLADEEKIDEKNGFYLMYYHDRATIFPEVEEPGIHLINHSCSPNVWMSVYRGHTLYFTLRKIFPGEELNVSYLLSPDKDCNPCTHPCYCDSPRCTKTMHMDELHHEKWSEFNDQEEQKTKRERIRFGKVLPLLDSYPETIPDHEIYTLIGSSIEKPEAYKENVLPSQKTLRKRIRETGKMLEFPRLNMRVIGISNGKIISEHIASLFV